MNIFPSLYILAKLSSILCILCLNEFILFVDFKSEERLFHTFGPKLDRQFLGIVKDYVESVFIKIWPKCFKEVW